MKYKLMYTAKSWRRRQSYDGWNDADALSNHIHGLHFKIIEQINDGGFKERFEAFKTDLLKKDGSTVF